MSVISGFDVRTSAIAMTVSQVNAPGRVETMPPLAPKCFGLSWQQFGVWRRRDDPGATGATIVRAFRLSGALDIAALRAAVQAVAQRHEMLRAAIELRDGHPIHVIDESATITLTLCHDGVLPAWLEDEAARPIALDGLPLIRFSLLRLGGLEHCLVIAAHPILFDDDRSVTVLLRTLSHFYSELVSGRPVQPMTEPLYYAGFVEWERGWLQSADGKRSLDYWTEQLSTGPADLDLPTDRPRLPGQSNTRGWRSKRISEDVAQGLGKVAHAHQVSLFSVLLTAFQVLLRRYTRQDDIVVIVPVSPGIRQEMAEVIGHFSNQLALRVSRTDDPTFQSLLAHVHGVVAAAEAHSDLPFEMLPDSGFARAAFSLSSDAAAMDGLVMHDLVVTTVATPRGGCRFDLALQMRQGPDELVASLEYCADLFDPATAERVLQHFDNLLIGIVDNPSARVSALPMLMAWEPQQLGRVDPNAARYWETCCLHELVEAQVRRTPDAIAVLNDGRCMTYRELNRRSNTLARRLRQHASGPDFLVAVCFERSFEMVIGILAVLKAGCAYVPVDPASPAEQIETILRDAETELLLTHDRYVELMPAVPRVICLDVGADDDAGDADDLGRIGSPADLAYVIYTSGSTGQPKGVMITHQGVCSTLLSMQATFTLTPDDRVLQRCAFTWDPSICEIFLALISGAQLVMAPPDPLVATAELGNLIRSHRITCLTVVPSLLQTLLDSEALERCTSLRHVFCGGEIMPARLSDEFARQSTASLHNLYGPTEISIWATFWTCQPNYRRHAVPIGRPFPNHEILILDRHRNLVPVGVIGELHIGGAGLARGYWRRPDLSGAAFIPNPFDDRPGLRLYRTGDLARYLPDGNIEFVGREDFQVKITGFRVELGEIEGSLATCPGVRNAVVLAREDTLSEKRLVAYLTVRDGCEVSIPDVRRRLSESLADFMIPSAFVVLGSFPETRNGKLDRGALPAPQYANTERARYAAPVGPVETAIAALFQTVLGVEPVGRHDHFFFDLGGHSLLAVRLNALLRKQTGVDLPLAELFRTPTVAGLAEFVGEQRASAHKGARLRGGESQLVEITKANGRPPLFCIHGAKGNVLIFSDLAKQLGPEQPMFAFEARGIDGLRPAFDSVAELVDCYREEIQRIQPNGPYFLLGYSVGGTIAFELAQQLRAANEDVAMVALVDTICPSAQANVRRRSVRQRLARGFLKGQALAVQTGRLTQWPRYHLARYLAQHGKMIPLRLRENYVANSLEIIFAPHRPRPYPGKIILFRAQPEETGLGLDAELGWKGLTESVDVLYGTGTHDTIIRLPNVAVFAEKLQGLLQTVVKTVR